MDYYYTGHGQTTRRPVQQQQQQPGMVPQAPPGAIPQGQFVPMGGRGVPVHRGMGGPVQRGRGVGYGPPPQAQQPPSPLQPRIPQRLLVPPRLAPVRPVGYINPEQRKILVVDIFMKNQEEDDRKRDAMRQEGLPSPAYAPEPASSIYAAPSANSSGVSLPLRNSAYDQNRIRQEFLLKNQNEEKLECIPEGMPDPGAARGGGGRSPLPSPRSPRPRPHTTYEVFQPPTRKPITEVVQPGDPQFSRPGTGVSVASLPETPEMQAYEMGWQSRRYTLPSSGPAVPAAPTGERPPPPPPPPPPQPRKDSTEGFSYKGPIGPWFPGMTDASEPASPTSPNSSHKGPRVVELEGVTRPREGAHCMTDDISYNHTVGDRHGYSSELERPCLSDDLAPGSFIGDEKGRLPDGLSFAPACLSDDLALVSDVIQEDPRRRSRLFNDPTRTTRRPVLPPKIPLGKPPPPPPPSLPPQQQNHPGWGYYNQRG